MRVTVTAKLKLTKKFCFLCFENVENVTGVLLLLLCDYLSGAGTRSRVVQEKLVVCKLAKQDVLVVV